LVNWRVATQRNYRGADDVATWQDKLETSWRALPALMLPVIILGGMRAGWFTPTEASVVAVFYALVCGKWIYRTLRWQALPDILSRSALLTASVLIIIGMSNAFAWVLTVDGLPLTLAEWMAAQNFNAVTFLIAVNIFLLIFGIFIEPLPGVMVLVPILAPVAAKLGIDPIHFAMVVIFNLTLGMITPPVGGLLFVTSNVAKVPLAALTRELKPFLVAHGVILLMLTFWPALSTWMPHALGFK
jgi:C4-dicarboxylate transporter DctM subunit